MSSVTRAATVVGALSAVSLLLGFLRDIVIAAVYGASAEVDAYLVAQGLMNVVLGLVAGALAKAVVPVVAPAAATGQAEAAHRSVATALAVAIVAIGSGAIAVGVFAGEVVGILAPGFDTTTSQLAADLTRVVLVATVLIAATNVLAAIAQSHRRFFWASAQGIPFNVVMIVAAAVLGPRIGISALAIGFVVGSAARLLTQLIPLRALGVRLVPTLDRQDAGLRTIGRLVPPLLVGSAVGNVNTMVDRAVASIQPEGTIAALSYGWRVASLGDTLVVASFVAVLYPAFGAASAPAARHELRRLVARGLTALTVVVVPAITWVIVAAMPIVALIYGRGSFDREAVSLTTTALVWYAPALVALAWVEVVTRAFYALEDSRTPVLVALLAVAVNIIGDVTIGIAYGVPGIAASTVLSLVVAAGGNTVLLARRHQAIDGWHVAKMVTRLGLIGIGSGMIAAATLALVQAGPAPTSAGWPAVERVAVAGVIVAVFYAAALVAFRTPEAAFVRDGLVTAKSFVNERRRHRSRR